MRFIKRNGGTDSAPAPTASTSDPPFIYREPRQLTLNHVLNDVYCRSKAGKKWHRVYVVGYDFADGTDGPALARYGRGYSFVCGDGVYEFEPREGVGPDVPPGPEGWVFEPTPFRTDVPDADDICKSCRQSDAKYGKGDIPSKTRWDR